MREEVFIILKPDTISRDLVDKIVARLKRIGKIEWVSGRYKSTKWCRGHYAHIANNPELIADYAVLEGFMTRSLLIGFGLSGLCIIEAARAITGATRVSEAERGTIRGDFGLPNRPVCYNLVHVADSSSAVLRETDLFLDRRIDYDFGITTH